MVEMDLLILYIMQQCTITLHNMKKAKLRILNDVILC